MLCELLRRMDTQITTPDSSVDQQRVVEMLHDFDTVMLGTYDAHGASPQLHARPMAVGKVRDDGTIYFVTSLDSRKVDEAAAQPSGVVLAQSSRRFLTLHGTFRISNDGSALKDVWSKSMDVWFDGPDDPKACLLIFRPVEAELWDASGARGIKYLFEAAKALLTGDKPPQTDGEQHAKVRLGSNKDLLSS